MAKLEIPHFIDHCKSQRTGYKILNIAEVMALGDGCPTSELDKD